MNSKIFKAYDIRGIYPADINEKNIVIITRAIYKFFSNKLNKKNLSIVLGQDMRLSSPALFEAVKKTLLKLGTTVIEIGLASTPTVYFAVHHYQYDAGIQVSASHNPKEWNGLKFFYRQGKKIIKVSRDTGMDEIKSLSIKNQFSFTEKQGRIITKNQIVKDEVDFAFNTIKPKINNFKIVVDTANAMGSLFIEEIFKRTDCQLIKMNFNLDGTFPSHEANPLKFELLKPLIDKVITEQADLGIATDGDGDRIFFIDEKGRIVPATIISALIAREILTKNKNEKILVDVRYTRNTSHIVEKYSGKTIFNVIGHALITKKLNEVNGAFSGESSGHFYFRETGGGESSIRAVYFVLDALSKLKKPFSKIVNELMTSFESGEFNFKLPDGSDSQKFLKKITNEFKEGKYNWMDGVSIDFSDWRFNIRASNTEPLIRLNLEADSEELMHQKLKEVKDKILSLGAIPD